MFVVIGGRAAICASVSAARSSQPSLSSNRATSAGSALADTGIVLRGWVSISGSHVFPWHCKGCRGRPGGHVFPWQGKNCGGRPGGPRIERGSHTQRDDCLDLDEDSAHHLRRVADLEREIGASGFEDRHVAKSEFQTPHHLVVRHLAEVPRLDARIDYGDARGRTLRLLAEELMEQPVRIREPRHLAHFVGDAT
eukprot:4624909-Prymnesium_polylepis.1